MNLLIGIISNLSTHGNLTMVNIDIDGQSFKAIVIDTPETLPLLEAGNPVSVMFKETEVVIGAFQEHNISLRNRLSCIIESIDKGDLLSKLVLSNKAGSIGSVITTNAVEQLELREGMQVWAMIKTNEVMIDEA